MEKVFDWSTPILAALSHMLQSFLEYLPLLFGAFATLILGWLIARIARALTVRIAKSFDRLSDIPVIGKLVSSRRANDSVVVIAGNVVFWLVMLFFLTAATDLLGLTMFAGWLDRVIEHLPNLLSGALIILAGVVFGNIVKDIVGTAAQSMPLRQQTLLARGAQVFTIVTMIVIGVDQIGIDITVLITIMAITMGALLGGVAIAFSLGSKSFVSNLIGARYLNKDYRVGESIRVGKIEGKILEVTSIAVVLETNEGRVTVPAQIFGEEVSLLLHKEKANAG